MINIYLSVLKTDQEKSQFEELYIKYKNRMYSISYSILNNKEDVEDCVQQAFLTIANNFDKISKLPRDELEAYIVVIIRNISIDVLNKNKKSAERFTELDEQQAVDVSFFENFEYNRLIEIISGLPQKYKDILFLYYLEELSAKEVSEILGISTFNVYKRLERAKKLLKAELLKE